MDAIPSLPAVKPLAKRRRPAPAADDPPIPDHRSAARRQRALIVQAASCYNRPPVRFWPRARLVQVGDFQARGCLVRIAYIRVPGGWAALENAIHKYDCRAAIDHPLRFLRMAWPVGIRVRALRPVSRVARGGPAMADANGHRL